MCIRLVCREQNGVIVTLDELGHVNCSYLGTDPSLFSVALSTSRDPNFEVSQLSQVAVVELIIILGNGKGIE